ncbi:nitroreductase family protein [Paenibacillus sp. CAA11]|uniref:nitroreductase family protein n=1 Tax=Paenibacillus sp. CAA11 TaxID=1532905 RepID=UPI000D34DA3A|nr:nitroreductase family protein [Paenibacillus sp. CAA11]AWB46196.1 nitroreductase family protein [Paenibacillus sp. CAA11]
MSAFDELIQSRRSAMKFQTDVQISQHELSELFHAAALAPSCYNLQHTHYVAVTKPEEKEKLKQAAGGQHKVVMASAAIVVLGDLDAYKKADQIYGGMRDLGIMSQLDYDLMLDTINGLYESRGAEFQKEEAIRNASLSAMLFMLNAKDKGWDTCPMIGFDPEAVRELLHIPDHLIPVMMITLGKEDTSKQRPRGYRKPVAEFVTFDRFC